MGRRGAQESRVRDRAANANPAARARAARAAASGAATSSSSSRGSSGGGGCPCPAALRPSGHPQTLRRRLCACPPRPLGRLGRRRGSRRGRRERRGFAGAFCSEGVAARGGGRVGGVGDREERHASARKTGWLRAPALAFPRTGCGQRRPQRPRDSRAMWQWKAQGLTPRQRPRPQRQQRPPCEQYQRQQQYQVCQPEPQPEQPAARGVLASPAPGRAGSPQRRQQRAGRPGKPRFPRRRRQHGLSW